MSRRHLLGLAFLVFAECSDSKGKLTLSCVDDKQEEALAARARAANAFADGELAPYRDALKGALAKAPATGAGRCELFPPNKDWAAIAYDIVLGRPADRGVTLVGPMYVGTDVNAADAVVPSRVRRASETFSPRNSVQKLFNIDPACPDYPSELADWAALTTKDFWTYEIVVVDEGDAGRSELRMEASGKTKESHAPSWCVAKTKPLASAVPSASAAPNGEAFVDDGRTRCGRIFGYDYAKKAVTCYAHFTLPYLPADLGGDQKMEGALLVAGVAALRATE